MISTFTFFVMETKHRNRLVAQFTRMLDYKKVHVLGIPDDYQFMDQELIAELEAGVGVIIGG